ncbi:MAG: sigma-70 family RNA polymerase sigma factor [Planctomycetes bacterium]|nr:sigma-70 family RNA polymerase sigma factor [Planctomycetota bacterium]
MNTFRGPLIGLLASWGRNWRDAEEFAADAFAEAWIARSRFLGDPHDVEAVGAWLRGIAFRLHSASQRNAAVRRAEPLDRVEPAEAAVEADERSDVLAAALAKLKPAQQTILRMHYLEQTNVREVAALLGVTVKAAEERLYQARKELRELAQRELRRRGHGGRS